MSVDLLRLNDCQSEIAFNFFRRFGRLVWNTQISVPLNA